MLPPDFLVLPKVLVRTLVLTYLCTSLIFKIIPISCLNYINIISYLNYINILKRKLLFTICAINYMFLVTSCLWLVWFVLSNINFDCFWLVWFVSSNINFDVCRVAAKEKVDEVSSGDLEDDGKMICLDGDWDEPPQSLYTEYSRSSDMAFRLLETDSSVQRMVVSLSSDQAVWDAVMNNEVVKELRESIHGVGGESLCDGEGGDESILEWIVMFAKAKIMAVLEKIRELMMIRPNPISVDCGLNEKVKTSFFLSMLVMIIVVVARAKNNNAWSQFADSTHLPLSYFMHLFFYQEHTSLSIYLFSVLEFYSTFYQIISTKNSTSLQF